LQSSQLTQNFVDFTGFLFDEARERRGHRGAQSDPGDRRLLPARPRAQRRRPPNAHRQRHRGLSHGGHDPLRRPAQAGGPPQRPGSQTHDPIGEGDEKFAGEAAPARPKVAPGPTENLPA